MGRDCACLPRGGPRFPPGRPEEARLLGYDDDDPVMLPREASGRIFGAKISATVRVAPRQLKAADG
jgi:hypothetical protein